jgi:hypothetical protein
MPFTRLTFKPGINRDQTNYTGEGGWWECDKVRFFSGYPQKLGGWLRYTVSPVIGTCRQMWGWITTFSDNFMALGTNEKVYIEAGGNLADITPLEEKTAAGDVTFTATDGSSVITVTDVAFPSASGNYVTFVGAVSLGGNITAAVLNQNYKIASVIDGDNYTIEAKSPTTGAAVTANAADAANYVFTANSATDVITFSVYTPVNNTRLRLKSTGGSLPTGLSATTVYYIINASGTTCQLSLTSGGGAVDFSTNGTGTLSAQGGATIGEYEISIGNPGGTYGYGWGAGGWGRGGWGSGTTQPILLEQRDWWFDNIDNDLVMNIRDGELFYWERGTLTDPDTSLAVRAKLLSDFADDAGFDPDLVPVKVMQALVSQNDKHLITFGSVPYGSTDVNDFDPLLIRWATQDNPFNWEISPTTSAGFIRVSRGSRIVRALATRQEILVWTESHLFALQFLGTTDVFGLQEYADNISVISPRGMATTNNITYWMGTEKFYAYSGRVDTLPCSIRNYIFNDLNKDQADQIICGTNEGFNEIWWFYPSSQSNTNDRYVIYNHLEKVWYYGNLPRTAWIDSPLRDFPQAVETDFDTQLGTIYNHEQGVNEDTEPMVSYIQSNDFDINEGDKFILTKRIIPDISFANSVNQNPEVTFAIRSRNFPGSDFNPGNDDTARVTRASVDSFTQQIFIRTRARQLALRVSSEDLGTQWQFGTPRLDGRQDGER